ncbi:MAG: HAD family phosphatase [Desulfuromonadales bacterium]|nr:HAD family phosphatase [Desulfuromonadales bacterium]
MNIIFDLGGVVVTWDPNAVIARVFEESEVRGRVRSEVIGHADWLEYDRGTLPRQDAIARAALRTGLPEPAIDELFQQVPHSLVPIPGTLDLLQRLKQRGHRLYLLSNIHQASIEHLESSYGFWDLFEGMVISCRIHLVKPEAAIYVHLLQKYALDCAETVFIDDTEINLKAAGRFGIRTIRFENPQQCELRLRELGCI